MSVCPMERRKEKVINIQSLKSEEERMFADRMSPEKPSQQTCMCNETVKFVD